MLRALLPPSFTCSSVQAFILPAMCEYCTDGARIVEEAFLRAKIEAAPARRRGRPLEYTAMEIAPPMPALALAKAKQ